jgi:DNA-binding response OmpR family regulator
LAEWLNLIKPKLNGLICLIIEPENSAAQILAIKLLNGGYSSSHVHSCKAAMDLLKNPDETFDAILVNASKMNPEIISMPADLKSLFGKKNRPPILSYSYTRDNLDAAALLKMGYTDFFSRPIEPDILWEKIEIAIKPEQTLQKRLFAPEMSESCIVKIDFEISSLNEIGVELLSSMSLPVGLILQIESKTLRECGVANTECRIASQQELTNSRDENKFKAQAQFISLKPEQRQKLRLRAEALARNHRKV